MSRYSNRLLDCCLCKHGLLSLGAEPCSYCKFNTGDYILKPTGWQPSVDADTLLANMMLHVGATEFSVNTDAVTKQVTYSASVIIDDNLTYHGKPRSCKYEAVASIVGILEETRFVGLIRYS